jgi:hypothetical protein
VVCELLCRLTFIYGRLRGWESEATGPWCIEKILGQYSMPILECLKCGREGYIPMAACDEVLHQLPQTIDGDKFLAKCADC